MGELLFEAHSALTRPASLGHPVVGSARVPREAHQRRSLCVHNDHEPQNQGINGWPTTTRAESTVFSPASHYSIIL